MKIMSLYIVVYNGNNTNAVEYVKNRGILGQVTDLQLLSVEGLIFV